MRVHISGKTDFELQNPSQVLDVGGPSVVALCGRFDGGVDPIPDDLGRDALDDPVKDLGLGNPIAGDGNAQVTSALRRSSQKVDKRTKADINCN